MGFKLSNITNKIKDFATGDWGHLVGEILGPGLGAMAGWTASQAGAKQQQKWNKDLMKLQYKYTTKLGKQQYKYTNRLQQQQQQYETQMSSTAHQREVEDLKSAGLNPILSANGGASTPSTGLGTVGMGSEGMPQAPITDYAQQLQNAISNAFQKRQLDQQEEAIKAEANLKYAQIENVYKEGHVKDAIRAYTESQKIGQDLINENLPKKLKAEIKQMESNTKFNAMKALESSAIQSRINEETEYQKLENMIKRFRNSKEFQGDPKSDNINVGLHASNKGFGFEFGRGKTRY